MKTLVVEDDFTSRLVLQKILSPYGETHVATNGAEAVEAYSLSMQQQAVYDLICLDIMMPVMDGHTTLKTIRELERNQNIHGLDRTRIIMTTALNSKTDVLTSFRSQCDAYLLKPIDRAKLLEQLREFGFIQ